MHPRTTSNLCVFDLIRDDCKPCPHNIPYYRLEPLRSDLLLRSSNGLRRLGVDEPATLLAVLERGCLCRADTEALAVVGAAFAAAVGVVHAPSGDELVSLAVSDILGTGVVGLDEGEGRDGN
jgi:hypothetical protein